ncbi:MAG TPA: GvpL/GvpF family gas vesicle protein [Thermoleophilaceae bacterium]|nr:GvpL/GvpF family gas vesicle protein [Thermoleophilaceae bacterium]
MTESPNTYVYAVIPADDAHDWPEMPGIEGASSPARTIVEGELAAVVSDISPDRTPGRPAEVETHRRILAQAIERTTTIPMRFGIVMPDDDTVRERLLSRHADELAELVDALDGRIQMTVKAFYADDALLRDVMAANPELAQESAALAQDGDAAAEVARVRIGELVAAAVDARRAEVEAALVEELSPLADDVQVEPPSSERSALNAQLLIRRERRPELDEKVKQLGDALTGLLGFRYIGPLPPYSFANVSLEESEEAWA